MSGVEDSAVESHPNLPAESRQALGRREGAEGAQGGRRRHRRCRVNDYKLSLTG